MSKQTANFQVLNEETSLVIKEDLIFGFRLKLKGSQVGANRQLCVNLYHPKIKTFFRKSDQHLYSLLMEKDRDSFVGIQLDKEELMLVGEWRFIVSDPYAKVDQYIIFEPCFYLEK